MVCCLLFALCISVVQRQIIAEQKANFYRRGAEYFSPVGEKYTMIINKNVSRKRRECVQKLERHAVADRIEHPLPCEYRDMK
jgi:hypothetical protein